MTGSDFFVWLLLWFILGLLPALCIATGGVYDVHARDEHYGRDGGYAGFTLRKIGEKHVSPNPTGAFVWLVFSSIVFLSATIWLEWTPWDWARNNENHVEAQDQIKPTEGNQQAPRPDVKDNRKPAFSPIETPQRTETDIDRRWENDRPSVGAQLRFTDTVSSAESDAKTSAAKQRPLDKRSASMAPYHELREWTDSSGRFRTTASFMSMTAGQVKLRKEDGSMVEVAVESLSDTDKDFIRRLRHP